MVLLLLIVFLLQNKINKDIINMKKLLIIKLLIIFYSCGSIISTKQYSQSFIDGSTAYLNKDLNSAASNFKIAYEEEILSANPNQKFLYIYSYYAAYCYFYYGNLKDALTFGKKSLLHCNNDLDMLQGSYAILCGILDETGNKQEAIKFANNAIKYSLELNDKLKIAANFRNLGDIYFYSKINDRLTFSLEYYLKALENDKIVNNFDGLYLDYIRFTDYYNVQEDFENTKKFLLLAEEMYKLLPPDSNQSIDNLNESYGFYYLVTKNYEKAIEYFKIIKSNNPNNERKQYRMDDSIGRAYFLNKQYELSSFYMQNAIQWNEKYRNSIKIEDRVGFYTNNSFLYEILASSYINISKNEKAFETIQFITSRSFTEEINSNAKQKLQPLEKIQDLLNSDEALILFPSNSSAWFNHLNKINAMIVSKDNIQSFEKTIPDSINIAILIKSFVNLLSHGVNSSISHTKSKLLYSLIFEPIVEKLNGINNLFIIPNGYYNNFPFESLQNKNGKYLIEEYSLSYVQSPTYWYYLKQKPIKIWDFEFLGIGGADYSNSSFIDLPYSQLEVDSISSLFNSTALTGQFANESVISDTYKDNINNYKMVHFATHGFYNNLDISKSGIVLSQNHFIDKMFNFNGIFEVDEIKNSKINVDFINLSACELGSGIEIFGDGSIGLVQAFLLAGSNSVSASLWTIDDKSAYIFMKSFYKKIQNGYSYRDANILTKRECISGKHGDNLKSPTAWSSYLYFGI